MAGSYKIWIAGAKGSVGSALRRELSNMKYQLYCTDIEDVDITDLEQVELFADMQRPDVIINCAGVTDVQYCEEHVEQAYKVNAVGARNLSLAAGRVGAKMIQISTDDVFAGDSMVPYNEFEFPAPRTVYGKSKYAGENFVKELVQKHIIVRSSWVYGLGRDYVDYVLEESEKKEVLEAAHNQFAVPTSAVEIARVIVHLMEESLYGVYHVVCKGSCSRYEFAQEIIRLAGRDTRVVPVMDNHQIRPNYSVLDNLMLRITGVEEPGDWKEVLEAYMEEWRKNQTYEK